jgi:hypothetical protein
VQRLAGEPAGNPGAKREERVDADPVSQTAVDSKGCRWTLRQLHDAVVTHE